MGKAKIFINYRRNDVAGHAGRINDYLSKHFETFFDTENIEGADSISEKITDGINQCDFFIMVMGSNAISEFNKRRNNNQHDFVLQEIMQASSTGKTILLIRVDIPAFNRDDIPEYLPNIIYDKKDFKIEHENFQNDMRSIIKKIKKTKLNTHSLSYYELIKIFFNNHITKNQKSHFYSPSYNKTPIIKPISVAPNQIALVIALKGHEITNDNPIRLGKVVSCNNFQNHEQFFRNGGQQGAQLQVLTTGHYYINTEFFTVITKENALDNDNDLKPESLKSYIVKDREIGIVTVLTGEPNNDDDINSVDKSLHNSYQDPQAFFNHGGKQGLQEEILTPGKYYINPWFAKIQATSITEIPIGAVGVVISHTGKESNEIIVDEGYKGVRKKIIRGKKNINTETKTVHLIPTMDITLEWSPKKEKLANSYDKDLPLLKLSTKDGYTIILEVSQTIKIKEEDAPKLISRLHGIRKSDEQISKDKLKYPAISSLITRVIKSSVQSYFTNIAQQYEALDFKTKKDEIQNAALKEVQSQLDEYGVEAKRLTISIDDFPESLNQKLQKKTILALESKIAPLEHQKKLDDIKAANVRAGIEAETQLAKEKHIMEMYGKDQYFEMKKIENLIQVNFPDTVYGNNSLIDVIANNFQPHQLITEDNIQQTVQMLTKHLEESGLGVNISKTINNNDIDNK